MPEGRRIAPTRVLCALERDYPDPWLVLDAMGQRACLQRAVRAGVRGGALYDALIAVTAHAHGARLISSDRRARRTYEALEAPVTTLT